MTAIIDTLARTLSLLVKAWDIALRLGLGVALALSTEAAKAETTEVRIGTGFGIHYLPFYVMEHEQLLEKRAKAAGLPPLKVTYLRFSGGASLNDAIISGAADFAGAGVGPFAILWDKTRINLKIGAVAAMGDIPLVLLSNNPRIHSLKDVTDGDRIALPAIKASMQATLLQMASADLLGPSKFDALDQDTVSLPHSEATTIMLAGSGVVDMHFSVAPYSTRERTNPAVHQILSSQEIVGGPMSLNLVFCTDRFHAANPTITKLFVAALSEANDIIETDRQLAAKIYFEEDKGAATDLKMVEDALADPDLNYTIVPHGVGKFVAFMHRTGLIKNDPGSWKGLFFPDAQWLSGN